MLEYIDFFRSLDLRKKFVKIRLPKNNLNYLLAASIASSNVKIGGEFAFFGPIPLTTKIIKKIIKSDKN